MNWRQGIASFGLFPNMQLLRNLINIFYIFYISSLSNISFVLNYVPGCVYEWVCAGECRCPQKLEVLDHPGVVSCQAQMLGTVLVLC